ncbi:MAG: YoaK family protein [Bacteroidia bacterium]
MFRHKGNKRTLKDNLHLAAMLSFVAGMVDVLSLLTIKTLTTNVTGHFAHFSENISLNDYYTGFIFLIWILSFLVGAFFSNTIVELLGRKKKNPYSIVLYIEAFLLFLVGYWCTQINPFSYKNILACILLFSMGMQNSMVTKVSNAIVRTTHVTGLFTDLGIELSQLFFYKEANEQKLLMGNIKIRLITILFFFSGGIFCGVLYSTLALKLFFVAGFIVVCASFYERLRINMRHFLRQRNKRKSKIKKDD